MDRAIMRYSPDDVARDFLVKIGTLRKCAQHPDVVFDGDGDLGRAREHARVHITRGYLELPPGETADQFATRCESVYQGYSITDVCLQCAGALIWVESRRRFTAANPVWDYESSSLESCLRWLHDPLAD